MAAVQEHEMQHYQFSHYSAYHSNKAAKLVNGLSWDKLKSIRWCFSPCITARCAAHLRSISLLSPMWFGLPKFLLQYLAQLRGRKRFFLPPRNRFCTGILVPRCLSWARGVSRRKILPWNLEVCVHADASQKHLGLYPCELFIYDLVLWCNAVLWWDVSHCWFHTKVGR